MSFHSSSPPQRCETERPGVKWPTPDRSRVRATAPSRHGGQPAAVCSSLTRRYPLLAFDWGTFTDSTWLSAALKSMASDVGRPVNASALASPRKKEASVMQFVPTRCVCVCVREVRWGGGHDIFCISTSRAKPPLSCIYATCAIECSTFRRRHKAESVFCLRMRTRALHLHRVAQGENPLPPYDGGGGGGCHDSSP